jgi:chromosome segregation protein
MPPEAVSERDAASDALDLARQAKDAAEATVVEAERRLAREEEADAIAASLTLLVEHGERLGLHDDHCPLCAARRTSKQFAAGLKAARRRIASLSSGVREARKALANVRENARQALANFEAAEARVAANADEERKLRAQAPAHVEFYDQASLDHRFIQDPDGFLERALLVLDASQSVSRISSIESNIATLRDEIEKLADTASQSQAALASAREIERSVKRVSAEIIDERLAQISPLLNELYQRLRPHADWRTIDYSIRGDVRRFLSLGGGDGLNP